MVRRFILVTWFVDYFQCLIITILIPKVSRIYQENAPHREICAADRFVDYKLVD